MLHICIHRHTCARSFTSTINENFGRMILAMLNANNAKARERKRQIEKNRSRNTQTRGAHDKKAGIGMGMVVVVVVVCIGVGSKTSIAEQKRKTITMGDRWLPLLCYAINVELYWMCCQMHDHCYWLGNLAISHWLARCFHPSIFTCSLFFPLSCFLLSLLSAAAAWNALFFSLSHSLHSAYLSPCVSVTTLISRFCFAF